MEKWIWQRPEWPNLTYDSSALQGDFLRVAAKAGYLAGVRSSLSAEDQRSTLVDEVTAEILNSYAIEGETLSPKSVRDSLQASLFMRDTDIGARLHRGTDAYRNVADVMLDARNGARPMTVERMNGWHEMLFARDSHLDDVGTLRTDRRGPMQVVTVDRNGEISEVHYEAPPAEQLPVQMAKFTDWLAQTGPGGADADRLSTSGRAALTHLWFETLHPYSDGNGRIGRALVDYVASQNPVYADVPFSLSRAIQADKSIYYDALSETQRKLPVTQAGKLDATVFVAKFTGLIDQALDQSAIMAIHLNRRNRFFDGFGKQLNSNQANVLWELFARGPERTAEGISPRWYNRTADVSRQTASRDLTDLTSKGVLTGPHGSGPATRYHISSLSQGIPVGRSPAYVPDREIAQFAKLAAAMTDPVRKARAEEMIEQMSSDAEPVKSEGFEREQ